ncbi:hypothetical protein DL763_000162 [Monosporascus cannonballus]|nr:hypothetical protein DL763_000162 [Monosporascus cannonballus]
MTLVPIDEHSPPAARFEKVVTLPPINAERGLPSPASPGLTPPRELVAQIPEQYRPASVAAPLRRLPAGPQYASQGLRPVDRRVSAPALSQLAAWKGSPMAARDQLRLWGHVYYGDAKTADAFVIARSLRRPQTSVIDDERAAADRQSVTSPPLSRRTVRAIVRPRALERRPFLIQRTFDMDELRATIPDPPARRAGGVADGPAAGSSSSPSQVGATAPQRHQQPTSSSRRRSSSVKSGALLSGRSRPLDPESLMRDAKAVPIHLKYARAHLPPPAGGAAGLGPRARGRRRLPPAAAPRGLAPDRAVRVHGAGGADAGGAREHRVPGRQGVTGPAGLAERASAKETGRSVYLYARMDGLADLG